MIELDERDYLEARSVGIVIGDKIPEEFNGAIESAEELCRKCYSKCELYSSKSGVVALRIATGRVLEIDGVCEVMKDIVMKNRYKVIGG